MWLQTPDGRILKEWAGRRVAVAKAMEEALKNWRGAWEPLVSATEREARRDTSPSAGEPPPTGRNLSYIWFYIGPPLLIAWVAAQFYIDLAVKWRLLATLILVIGWFILFMVLPDGGYEARRRYDEEQEADFERRLEQRTTELLTVRYGFDPRGTSPWTGGLSTADVERFTQSQLERAASAYRLPADMSIPTLNLRAWRAPMPAGARDALRRLAPWAASAPEEPRALPAGSPAGQADTRPRGARSRGRALHMIEMMAIYEAAWARAWQGWEDDDGLGFDPFSSAPWEGDARAAVLEDALEAGGDPALPDLVLRDPDESGRKRPVNSSSISLTMVTSRLRHRPCPPSADQTRPGRWRVSFVARNAATFAVGERATGGKPASSSSGASVDQIEERRRTLTARTTSRSLLSKITNRHARVTANTTVLFPAGHPTGRSHAGDDLVKNLAAGGRPAATRRYRSRPESRSRRSGPYPRRA